MRPTAWVLVFSAAIGLESVCLHHTCISFQKFLCYFLTSAFTVCVQCYFSWCSCTCAYHPHLSFFIYGFTIFLQNTGRCFISIQHRFKKSMIFKLPDNGIKPYRTLNYPICKWCAVKIDPPTLPILLLTVKRFAKLIFPLHGVSYNTCIRQTFFDDAGRCLILCFNYISLFSVFIAVFALVYLAVILYLINFFVDNSKSCSKVFLGIFSKRFTAYTAYLLILRKFIYNLLGFKVSSYFFSSTVLSCFLRLFYNSIGSWLRNIEIRLLFRFVENNSFQR